MYQQLAHSYAGKPRDVAVEPARRRLGRRGLVDFFATGHASAGDGAVGSNNSADDPLSDGDAEGDEDQEADEDGGVDDDDLTDADDDGLAADGEDGDRDFQSRSSSDGEDKAAKTAHGEARDGSFRFLRVNGTDAAQGGAAVLLRNATENDGAPDGSVPTLMSGSPLKNTSSVDLSVLHAGGAAGDAVNHLTTVGAPGAENDKSKGKPGAVK